MFNKDKNHRNRRGFLKGLSAILGVGATINLWPSLIKTARGEGIAGLGGLKGPRKLDPLGGLSVVLLGTGTPLPNPERTCACTAIIAGNKVVLVDTGRGCVNRIAQAGLRNFDAVLFTHFHSDHFGEFGEVVITDAIWGRTRPVKVSGPVGANEVIGNLMNSYKTDIRFRKEHHKDKWSDAACEVQITEKNEGVVVDMEGLVITTFEVKHLPVKPALGYKIEYKGKKIVISGDTIPVPQMVEMANGADVLVHEAINKELLNRFRGKVIEQGGERLSKMMDEMMEYHSDVNDVAEMAAKAGVKKLVLTHLVPSIPESRIAERFFVQGVKSKFKGELIVGADLMEVQA